MVKIIRYLWKAKLSAENMLGIFCLVKLTGVYISTALLYMLQLDAQDFGLNACHMARCIFKASIMIILSGQR